MMGRSPFGRFASAGPFALGLLLAAATTNGALAPPVDELRIEQAPPAPAQSSPAHHDESTLDPSELVFA